MRTWVFAGLLVAASTGAALAQDVAAGEQSFNKCRPCHDVGPDAKVKLGPPLNGIDGRKSATYAGFNYSDAVKGLEHHLERRAVQAVGRAIRPPWRRAPAWRSAASRTTQEIGNLWAYVNQFKADGSKK